MVAQSKRSERRLLGVLAAIPLLFGLALAVYGYLTRDTGALEERRRLAAPLREGALAPDFTFPDLKGRPVSLSDFRGKKAVLVNVWATWCPPCKWEKPRMERLYQSMKGKDFEILAVSIDALGKDAVQPYLQRLGVTYPTLLDPMGKIKKLYRTTGVPESFVIDKGGRLIRKVIGPVDWSREEVAAFVTALASKGTPATKEDVKLKGDPAQHYASPPR